MEQPYRIPEGIVTIEIDEGPWAGVTFEARTSVAFGTLVALIGHVGAYAAADGIGAEAEALRPMGEIFARDVVVSWAIEDHLGPVPVDPDGFLRLPVRPSPMGIEMVSAWALAIQQPGMGYLGPDPEPAAESEG